MHVPNELTRRIGNAALLVCHVLDRILAWVFRKLLIKIRAFLAGVGGFFCLMVIGWIFAPIAEPLPVSLLIWFSIGGGVLVLFAHKYYARFKAVEKFMDWLERKATRRKKIADSREPEAGC